MHVTLIGGHRAEYLELFQVLFGLQPSVGRIDVKLCNSLCATSRLLFASLDDDIAGFVRVALARALRRRKTTALFIRPQSCFEPGLRGLLKSALFGVLRRLPGLTILTILPFELDPRLARVANGWIHDPQIWDRIGTPSAPHTALADEVLALAKGRKILVYLGRVTTIKGFPVVLNILAAAPDLSDRMLITVAGTVDASCRAAAERGRANGMVLVDRFLSEAEMASLYEVADLIWCCYDPTYDQASGIFGRALQRGRCAVVRRGAAIAGYGRMTAAAMVELDPAADLPPQIAAMERAAHAVQPPLAVLTHWKAAAVATLNAAL